jgi:uncharacterized membrane protein
MQARFTPTAIWTYLRSTYWFLPSVITVGAAGMASGLIALDRHAWDSDALPGWFFGGGADGARALLSAVAGSIITVVSVTFSVTIVALTVSSQHFGPRLLNNFMRDTVAQLVLGVFIGTFAYCLVVLRVVQGEGDGYDRFVPHLAVTGAVALTFVSVAALIYYVHHVAMSMQVSEIARGVVVDLEQAIDRIYPEDLGSDAGPSNSIPSPPAGAGSVPCHSSGYVQHIEADQILKLACDTGLVIWLQVRPGDFATTGLPLALVAPAPDHPERFAKDLNGAFVLGPDRTAQQDAGFPVQQLVEVTLHALSTGMNEPFTALTCIDRLGQGLARLATRRLPSSLRSDESGEVRVIAPRDSLVDLLDQAFDPIRAHAADSPEVGKRLLKVLARLARVARRDEDRAALARQAELVRQTMERWRHDGSYGEQIDALYRQMRR